MGPHSVILLDTHAALWLLSAPERLSKRATNDIATSEVCYFSAVSIAECSIKRMIGRIDVPPGLDRILAEQGLQPLPLRPEHAVAIEQFPELARHDPFDRLLLGQALVERCRFLTADDRLLALGLDWIVPASS